MLYIASQTRPDIQYAVGRLSRLFLEPSVNAIHAMKHLVRYLRRTQSMAIHFPAGLAPQLTASSDSDWSSKTDAYSTTGNVFLVGPTPVAWWSKKQTVIAQSTCEAEYDALRSLTIHSRTIGPLFRELFGVGNFAIATQIDNESAITTAKSRKITARNRHFLLREETVREAIRLGELRLVWTPSDEVIADGLTKGLERLKHNAFQIMLSMAESISV